MRHRNNRARTHLRQAIRTRLVIALIFGARILKSYTRLADIPVGLLRRGFYGVCFINGTLHALVGREAGVIRDPIVRGNGRLVRRSYIERLESARRGAAHRVSFAEVRT